MKILSLFLIAVGVAALAFGAIHLNNWRNSDSDCSLSTPSSSMPASMLRSHMETCALMKSDALKFGWMGTGAGVVAIGIAIALRRRVNVAAKPWEAR